MLSANLTLRKRSLAAFFFCCANSVQAQESISSHISKAEEHVRAALQSIEDLRSATTRSDGDKKQKEYRIAQLESTLQALDDVKFRRLLGGTQQLYYKPTDLTIDLALERLSIEDYNGALKTIASPPMMQVAIPGIARMLESPQFSNISREPSFQAVVTHMKAPLATGPLSPIGTPYKSILPLEERIAGLSLFWAEVRRSHVHITNLKNVSWDEAYLNTIPKVVAAESTEDYYRVLMTLPPLLRDAHVNVYPPEQLKDRFSARPNLRTSLVEGRIVVTAVLSDEYKGTIVPGDEILRIDGLPVKEYASKYVVPYVSYSTDQDRDVRVFDYQLLRKDSGSNVRVTISGRDGSEKTLTLTRGGGGSLSRVNNIKDLDDGYMYIKVSSFDNSSPAAELKQNIDRLMASRGLIIDLRDNGGGSSTIGYDLLACLTNRPIPLNRSTERREGGTVRLKQNAYAWQPLEGNIKSVYEKPCSRIIDKPVVLLIGPRTISAAEDFVSSFRALKRGLLIGMPTAGSTGQPYTFRLPGGGTARITVKHDVGADGVDFVGKGISPDITVVPTVADIRAGVDGALVAAREALNRTSN